jgi:hypothetical protein
LLWDARGIDPGRPAHNPLEGSADQADGPFPYAHNVCLSSRKGGSFRSILACSPAVHRLFTGRVENREGPAAGLFPLSPLRVFRMVTGSAVRKPEKVNSDPMNIAFGRGQGKPFIISSKSQQLPNTPSPRHRKTVTL